MFDRISRSRSKQLHRATAVFVEALEPRRLLTATLAKWAEAFVNTNAVNAGGTSVSTVKALTSEI